MKTDDDETAIYQPDPSLQEVLSSPEGRSSVSLYTDNTFNGKLTKIYMHKLFSNVKNEMNKTYGVYFGKNNTLMLSNSPITFDNDIFLNDIKYTGTRGLYKLIFMKKPNKFIYSEEDLKTYVSIIESTNAHKRGDKLRDNKGQNIHK